MGLYSLDGHYPLFITLYGKIYYMSVTDIVLSISEMAEKAFSIVFQRPYATVKVRLNNHLDVSDNKPDKMIELSIINDSFGDIDVQNIWFLTAYNRSIHSRHIDATMPLKVKENGRAKILVPVEELKAELNEHVNDKIVKAVVYDSNQRSYTGRIDKVIQETLSKQIP